MQWMWILYLKNSLIICRAGVVRFFILQVLQGSLHLRFWETNVMLSNKLLSFYREASSSLPGRLVTSCLASRENCTSLLVRLLARFLLAFCQISAGKPVHPSQWCWWQGVQPLVNFLQEDRSTLSERLLARFLVRCVAFCQGPAEAAP